MRKGREKKGELEKEDEERGQTISTMV